jgi:hypothetical protein
LRINPHVGDADFRRALRDSRQADHVFIASSEDAVAAEQAEHLRYILLDVGLLTPIVCR